MKLAAIGASVIAVSLALTGCGGSSAGSAAADAGSSSGGAVKIGDITVTKDAKIAAMLPKKYQEGLRFATSAPYAPWETLDSNNKLVGLDIDTGQAMAAVLGVPYSITSLSFDGLIPAVQAGKYDVITSSMSDSKAREEMINSVNYSEQGNALLVQAGNPQHITGMDDLCGHIVARQTGDVFGALIDKLQGPCQAAGKRPVEVKTYPSTSAALLALKSGEAQVQIGGADIAKPLIAANPGALQLITAPASLPFGWSPQVGGAQTLKSETELAKALAAAAQKLIDDGTFKKLFDKYEMGDHLMPKVTVNEPMS
ncbi:transporter substrate-binding domain-containing protein [Microbacterium sp. ASV81]|uniref:Transporter substrate-binding domain-containing protein n=2 Tax=Microbacterium capsulatum TaxID=3041921 RepID=A0ABU0XBS7_9MICO|nr:transporter substrate-binding domain-containing protein [Microbacterium sp. ASV81]